MTGRRNRRWPRSRPHSRMCHSRPNVIGLECRWWSAPSTANEPAGVAAAFDVRLIRPPNGGLGGARNAGAAAATGEIVAYLDADAWPDPHWLHYLADTFERTGSGAVGGPNIPPPGANAVAESVAQSPGGPIHVLVSDN